jgi:hypothetical protein
MKRFFWLIAALLVFGLTVSFVQAGSAKQSYVTVTQQLVNNYNQNNFNAIPQDFNPAMRKAAAKGGLIRVFEKLFRNYGKIINLGEPRLNQPGMAVFPAHFERNRLDIKIVLDGSGRIAGLWFLPPAPARPVPDKHETGLCLPFEGRWLVVWGGDTKELNQHHPVRCQRFAFDFLIKGKDGKTYKNQGLHNEDYHAFGRKVLSPARGTVTDVISGVRDNAPGSMNPYSALGNTVIIRHRKYEYSVIAHFKKGSIRVKTGDVVEPGQVLGLCGNSGNSSEPHIHYHLQNAPELQNATGIKCHFKDLGLIREGRIKRLKSYSPVKNDIVGNMPQP